MKKITLFSVPLLAVFLSTLILGRSAWGAEIIRLAITLWCFIAGALSLGRLMSNYWRWCNNHCQRAKQITAKPRRKLRGVHRLAVTLSGYRGTK